MSDTEKDNLEAIVREITEDNLHDALYYDHIDNAALLIQAARREARRAEEMWNVCAADSRAAGRRIADLTAERDEWKARYAQRSDRDALLAEAQTRVLELTAERDDWKKAWNEQQAVMRAFGVEDAQRLTAERDAARKERDAAVEEANVFADQKAVLMAQLAHWRGKKSLAEALADGDVVPSEEIERLQGENHRLDKYLDETQERESGLRARVRALQERLKELGHGEDT